MENSAQLRRLSAREYWEKARKIMRTNAKIKLREQRGRRAKYSGPGAVAVVENVQRRLRAIIKWKNPALRYCELWLGNTNMATRMPSVWKLRGVLRDCSRAFGAWVFHVRERSRLRQVRV